MRGYILFLIISEQVLSHTEDRLLIITTGRKEVSAVIKDDTKKSDFCGLLLYKQLWSKERILVSPDISEMSQTPRGRITPKKSQWKNFGQSD